jgi:ribonuclease HII
MSGIGLMEARLLDAGFSRVAGVDEVGRGALAGPLVAAAVVLPENVDIEGLRDSKTCTPKQREQLSEAIHEVALSVSIVRIRHDRIDRIGLQKCNRDAFRRAIRGLDLNPDYVLVDYLRMKRFNLRPWSGLAVKKGDVVSKNVAAASIVAKVYRDRAMRRYHRRYRQYGFDRNVGYGTREHWNALIRFGPSPIHRRTFYGVEGFVDERGVFTPHPARGCEEAEIGEITSER